MHNSLEQHKDEFLFIYDDRAFIFGVVLSF